MTHNLSFPGGIGRQFKGYHADESLKLSAIGGYFYSTDIVAGLLATAHQKRPSRHERSRQPTS